MSFTRWRHRSHHLLTDAVTVESSLSKGHGRRQRISRKASKRQWGGVSRFLSLYKSCCYSAYRHQPPPSLPRRGGTDTLECLTISKISIFGVTCISPSGENERGLKSAGKSSALGLFRFIARCLLRGGNIGRHHLLTDVVTVESSLSKGHGRRQRISRKARKRQRGFIKVFVFI